jgi:hypothetical protein
MISLQFTGLDASEACQSVSWQYQKDFSGILANSDRKISFHLLDAFEYSEIGSLVRILK